MTLDPLSSPQGGVVSRGADGRSAVLPEQGGAARGDPRGGSSRVQPAHGAESPAGGQYSTITSCFPGAAGAVG